MSNSFVSTTRKELIRMIEQYEKQTSELMEFSMMQKREIEHLSALAESLPLSKPNESTEITHQEKAGYILAMRLLQSDLVLDDAEMAACSLFTKPEIIRFIMKGTHGETQ
jgi:hypothetical protein